MQLGNGPREHGTRSPGSAYSGKRSNWIPSKVKDSRLVLCTVAGNRRVDLGRLRSHLLSFHLPWLKLSKIMEPTCEEARGVAPCTSVVVIVEDEHGEPLNAGRS